MSRQPDRNSVAGGELIAFRGLYPASAGQALEWIGLGGEASVRSLPFCAGDVTAGTETELQAAVQGRRDHADLPLAVQSSSFYANLLRRVSSGEAPRGAVSSLERYLDENGDQLWENSWVRFPLAALSRRARETLEMDLSRDKKKPSLGIRSDSWRYLFEQSGEPWVRVPVSYLLKLALADYIGTSGDLPWRLTEAAEELMGHFLNDNTSPETTSFYVSTCKNATRAGESAAEEKAVRFLLTQLLLIYANRKFQLTSLGQRALTYLSPLPPTRQRELNACIPDSLYRELFMSPCLSGWDRGEEKHEYMGLCHRVLSRSQLNALPKLREAGIIRNNLVLLPSMSNTSLANNGTHASLGSRLLSRALEDRQDNRALAGEKYLGDLVTKIVEHFLPLFVGTYTAAPHRLSFSEFHPEQVMGFLPHELHYDHLRMIWRRWKKKARIGVLGNPVTPFGPRWLDDPLATLLLLRGDYVGDFRLMDYLTCLLSTHENPGLDGRVGNWDRLKKDLETQGVFDPCMATYLLFRQREHRTAGYAGFEGRYYSVFESFDRDLAPALDLQHLLTFVAYWLISKGQVDHGDIPDTPFTESERRHVFFGSAIGLPTFFVKKDSGNRLLHRLIRRAKGIRPSRRYPGSIRVQNIEYRLALIDFLLAEAAEPVEALGMAESLRDLRERLVHPRDASAEGRLLKGILGDRAAAPLSVEAKTFNQEAERYYSGRLRKLHIAEAVEILRRAKAIIAEENLCPDFLDRLDVEALAEERLDPAAILYLIRLTLQFIHHRKESSRGGDSSGSAANCTPVC